MGITREQLYAEVWAEPMVVVAKRYGVSSTYLARICEELNVPRPPRGYWQQLKVGKAASKPSLPDAGPGDTQEWARGSEPYSVPREPSPRARTRRPPRDPKDRPKRHRLLVDAKELFEAGRVGRDDYLKPWKHNLVDFVVTKACLDAAIELANELFLTIEDHGHDVVLAARDRLYPAAMPQLGSQAERYDYDRHWRPGRPTLAFFGSVAIGLTVFETKEPTQGRWAGAGWMRLAEIPEPKRRSRAGYMGEITTRDMSSGKLAIHAYAPYSGVTWEKYWREDTARDLLGRCDAIASELQRAAPKIGRLAEEAAKKAAEEYQEMLRKHEQWEREESERRRAAGLKESRKELLDLAASWNEARYLEAFLGDIGRAVAGLEPTARVELEARLGRARELVGSTDAVRHFERWRTPEEI